MLSEAAPGLLTITDGTLWLTRGEGEDIILAAGDCAEIDASATPVSGALERTPAIEIVALEKLVPAHEA